MILPDTIPLLMGRSFDDTVKMILSEPDNHIMNIVRISKVCRVKVTFHKPESFYITRRKYIKDISEYIFPEFFLSGDRLYYKLKRGGRTGLLISFDRIKSYEPVLTTINEFNNYEQFKKKFDLFFIAEELIKELWESISAQHGGKYQPSDFKPVSKAGKEALRQFLRTFRGVASTDTTGYTEEQPWEENRSPYHILYGRYYGRNSNCNFSRDVDISHQIGLNRVFYSSTQTGGGHERNGILATRSTYLHLEDD